MLMNKIILLVASIIICLLAGVIGSFFTATGPDSWYAGIQKPVFNPPNWIFGPVWTVLFILMGVSLFMVWSQGTSNPLVRHALLLFGAQLVLNIIWSALFFGLESPLFAFLEILVLWVVILLVIISFFKVSKPAAYLLLPYIAWVSFAAILNFAILIINK